MKKARVTAPQSLYLNQYRQQEISSCTLIFLPARVFYVPPHWCRFFGAWAQLRAFNKPSTAATTGIYILRLIPPRRY
jgi:hypothetical protein